MTLRRLVLLSDDKAEMGLAVFYSRVLDGNVCGRHCLLLSAVGRQEAASTDWNRAKFWADSRKSVFTIGTIKCWRLRAGGSDRLVNLHVCQAASRGLFQPRVFSNAVTLNISLESSVKEKAAKLFKLKFCKVCNIFLVLCYACLSHICIQVGLSPNSFGIKNLCLESSWIND